MFKHERTLLDIVENIQIDSDFQILHPHYPPSELSPQTRERMQQLPPELQAKYLNLRLRDYLHALYFTHSAIDLATLAVMERDPTPIKNNLVDGVDIDFVGQLQQNNPSRGYLDPDWQLIATTPNGEYIVVKDGLHLHIDPQFHLPADKRQALPGEFLPLWLPPSLVARDAYIIVGEAGTPIATIDADPTVRLYFNFTPPAAVAIAHSLSHALNQFNIPFQFAILHDPQLFHRYDSGTLWLWQDDYLVARATIDAIYRSHQSEFALAIPLCTKPLAPGLSIAEEPPTGDFGLHRCEQIAAGLIAALASSATNTQAKLDVMRTHLNAAGIEWQYPHLNPDRTDIYTSFVI